jgi:PST family polysaccharide transporter
MSLRDQAVNGLLWSFLDRWGGKLFAFVIFLVLARLLDPAAFGLVALATVFVSFVQVFVNQGFAEAVVQRHDLEPAHLNTAFWTNMGMGVVMTLLGVLGAGPVAALFGEPALAPVVRVLSLAFLLSALNGVQTAVLKRDLAFRALTVRTLSANAVGGVVGVSMAFGGYGVWSLVAQQLVGKAVEVVVLWRASGWRPGTEVSREHFGDLFAFSSNVVGINVMNFLNRRSDDLLIGYFLGPVALGYYTVAYRILRTLLDVLTSVTRQVAFPVFSRMQREPARARAAFYKATQYTAFASFPVFFGLAATAPEVLPVVFGEQWAPSVPVMQFLAVGGALVSITAFNGDVLLGMGRASWGLRLSVGRGVVNVAAFAIAVHWGIVAVAAALAIRVYAFFPVTAWVMRLLIGLEYGVYLRRLAVAFSGSLVMSAAVVALRLAVGPALAPGALLAVAVGVGATVYAVWIGLFAPAVVREVAETVRLVQPRSAVRPPAADAPATDAPHVREPVA